MEGKTVDIALNESAATALLYTYRGWAVFPVYGIRNGVCRCPKGKRWKLPQLPHQFLAMSLVTPFAAVAAAGPTLFAANTDCSMMKISKYVEGIEV